MARTSSHSWGFVDEHRMHGLDILPAKTFQVGDEFGVGAVALEDLVELEILQLCNGSLSLELLALVFLDKSNVLDDLHAWGS